MNRRSDMAVSAGGEYQLHPFEPVFDENSRILILGSFPSVRSREEGFYYGHPRNRFWTVLARCLNEAVPADTEAKRLVLLKHNIALWDVLASCHINGSADSSISAAVPNDLSVILRCAAIERVLCNGATAGKLCRRYCGEYLGCEPVILPSTSPANAAWSPERLYGVWFPQLEGLV